MHRVPTLPLRFLVIAALAAVSCGLVACGDSADEKSASGSTDAATSAAGEGEQGGGELASTPNGGASREGAGAAGGDSPASAGDGGDDASTGGGGSATPGQAGGDTARPGATPNSAGPRAGAGGGSNSDEEAAKQVVVGMYKDFSAGNADGVCGVMSMQARNEIAQTVPGGSTVSPEQRTCQQSLGKFLQMAAQSGVLERTLSAKVKSVDVKGGVATVVVEIAGADGDVRLVREGGRWVFGGPPTLGKQ